MNKRKWLLIVVILMSVTFGLLVGNLLAHKHLRGMSPVSLPRFLRVENSKTGEMLGIINREYVDSIDSGALAEELVAGLASLLDPHSVYIPARDLAEVNSDLEGMFSGVGIQFNIQQDTVMIVSVISGGPSEKVGLLAGDRIIAVNDSNFTGKTITNERVMKNLRGKKGTQVKLTVRRVSAHENLTFAVTRGDIPVNSVVASYIIAPETGFIRVDKFGARTYAEFLNALATLHAQGARKFIIDLRENSGGFMDQAIEMANEFLPRGRMIVYAKGRSYPYFEAKADGKGTCIDNPVAVLIDDFSASASEIFAGAMQDNDRATVIGRRSFGKGLVQQQFTLSDNSAFRMTVARYYTPSGRSIQKPYTRGKVSDYAMDLINRYEHGEFYNADSVKLKDSLVYKTVGGRTVYGGGGIMPDIFVPRDTTQYTPYLTRAINAGYLFEFAFKYTDENRETLSTFKSWQDLKQYLDNQTLLTQFTNFTATKKLEAAKKDVEISKNLIINTLESYIIRNILGDSGFYPVFYLNDEVVKKAVSEMMKK
ncbi:MAG: S41 family peptidase [Prevotellaceae bacterium]|nr:S41 family peptidase [Prevotellaceae bacterium]